MEAALEARVREVARQYVGDDGDEPPVRFRVRMQDRGLYRQRSAQLGARLPAGAPPVSMAISFSAARGRRHWPRPGRDVLDAMAVAVRGELGLHEDDDALMELRVDGHGYEFRYHRAATDLEPRRDASVRLVLDGGYRYPGHPAPVTEPGPAPEAAPTDPAVLADVGGLVERFAAVYARVMGRAPEFGAGCSEAELAAAEARIGLRLPEDLRALYRVVQGDTGEHGLLGSQMLFPLDSVVAGYLGTEDDDLLGVPEWRAGLGTAVWEDGLFPFERVVVGGLPHGAVRRVSHSARWVTLGRNGGGRRFLAVDLDPGPAGTAGQLFEYEYGVLPTDVVAASVTALLRHVVEAAERGDHDRSGDGGPEGFGTLLRTPAPGGSGPNDPAYTGWPAGRRQVSDITELTEPAGELAGDRVGERACEAGDVQAGDVQALDLGGAARVSLAGLGPLTRLRVLRVCDAESADLALPAGVPVESLEVRVPSVDLAGLVGHPTLWDLTVAGTAGPVEIAPLAGLPALERLELAGVDVPDLELVAKLPRLRVLSLDAAQWQRLREAGAVPAGLAAAELAGDNPFDTEAEWLAGFDRAAAGRVLRGRIG
jgi:cell wall assembly regulator SMI1